MVTGNSDPIPRFPSLTLLVFRRNIFVLLVREGIFTCHTAFFRRDKLAHQTAAVGKGDKDHQTDEQSYKNDGKSFDNHRGQRTAEDDFNNAENDVTAVQNGERQQIENGKGKAHHHHEVDTRHE